MAKEYPDSPKIHQPSESKKRRLTHILGTSALCVLFYILGAYQNAAIPNPNLSKLGCSDASVPAATSAAPTWGGAALDFEAHHRASAAEASAAGGGGGAAAGAAAEAFPPCALNFSEYTPCQDSPRGRRFERAMLAYRERHCPAADELVRCLVPAPPGYRAPFKWPVSRDYAWYGNIPHKELSIEKAVQNWIQVEGDRFRFPGGGTMFPRGADAYIDDINALVPLTDGSIRTALDTGCGVASWGAYLLNRDIVTMSFAPRDTHEAQVQFALERGVPAMLGVMATQRIPYPARAFDMAHCSRCLIPWFAYAKYPLLCYVHVVLAPDMPAIN